MREIRTSGSEGGEAELNRPSLPLSRGTESGNSTIAGIRGPSLVPLYRLTVLRQAKTPALERVLKSFI